MIDVAVGADTGPAVTAARAFGLWSDPVLLLALVAAWFALAIVFFGETAIDRDVSALFFVPAACPAGSAQVHCGAFPLGASQFWTALRDVFHYLPMVCAGILVLLLARRFAAGRRAFRQISPRPLYATVALAALAVGPGLLVNLLLKEWWGRPRPVATDLFGGDLPFVPAGQWSDACDSNCSFVSGEASSIFWLICLIPLLPARWRGVGGVAIVAIAIVTALLRVAFGGHYLSDVVLGGLSTLVVFSALACLTTWLVARRRPA